jgi:small-conductance mechanosensitive channel
VKNNDFSLLIQARLTEEQLEARLTSYTEQQVHPCNERIKEKVGDALELIRGQDVRAESQRKATRDKLALYDKEIDKIHKQFEKVGGELNKLNLQIKTTRMEM